MFPPLTRDGGCWGREYCSGPDPISVSIGFIASFLQDISWMNCQSFIRQMQWNYRTCLRSWSNFGDLDLIFKVTVLWRLSGCEAKLACVTLTPEQSIGLDKGGYPVNIFLISPQKHVLWYTLEAPHQGASNEYSQHMFLWRNEKNINTFGLKKVP